MMSKKKLVITAGAFIISFAGTLGMLEIKTLASTQPISIVTDQIIISPLAEIETEETAGDITFAEITPNPTPSPSPTPSTTPIPKPSSTPKPIPTPQPSPTPVTGNQLDEWFTRYANNESIDRELLRKIAICESGLNPNAQNGAYGGMYQFTEGSWRNTRNSMNENQDTNLRFNAEEAIKTAAFKIARGGTASWPTCSK